MSPSAASRRSYGLIQSQSDGWARPPDRSARPAPRFWRCSSPSSASRPSRCSTSARCACPRSSAARGGMGGVGCASSMLTYLIIYMQNSLACRPSTRNPLPPDGCHSSQRHRRPVDLAGAGRALISVVVVLFKTRLMLMRGLEPSSDWTHLLPGMIVGGIGTGLVSTPLISTAVGVVEPARAGMASGINSTLRQVGIATGVAGLGTILSSQVRTSVVDTLSGGPLAVHAHGLAHTISSVVARHAIASTPARCAARRDDRPLGARRRPEHDPPRRGLRRLRRGRGVVRADPRARLRGGRGG